MNEDIMVSVLCTAYNQEKYIRKTLDGFLMQNTCFNVEYIIHDDASTDNTVSILEEYRERFPEKFVFILQKENQYSKGIDIYREFLIPKARGKYIAICEGDDYWISSNKLQKQIEYMEKNPDCSCTYHAVNYINDKGILKNDKYSNNECDIPTEKIISGGGAFCATLSLCFLKKYIEKYTEFMNIADILDYPLQINLALNGKVHYFPEIMGCYRVQAEGSWNQKMVTDNTKLIQHMINQKEWMFELNEYTNYQYESQIFENLIIYTSDVLYVNNLITKKELKSWYKKIKNKNIFSLYFWKLYLKSNFTSFFVFLKNLKRRKNA